MNRVFLLIFVVNLVEYLFDPIDALLNAANVTNTTENVTLSTSQLANESGHEAEEHYVVTEDGYNLTLFRIPGNGSIAMLTHGVFDSSDTFLLRGNGSLGINLANQGYDVWFTNHRGNKYSRRHITLDPDEDKAFWDFSFHEIGYYDMKANIDFVLNKTGQTHLQAIGHSLGTTVYYILTTLRPEYNDKIKLFISLAPVCFLDNVKPPVRYLADSSLILNEILTLGGFEEIFGNQTQVKAIENIICLSPALGYLCSELVQSFVGFDSEEIELDFFRDTLIKHYPAGTSRKNLAHRGQVELSKSFAHYDYGTKNIEVYGTSRPPLYNISNIEMRTALFVANNDKIATIADVQKLQMNLRNETVVEYLEMPYEDMNHIDFTLGKHMYQYLFPYIFNALTKYN